jgi:hypothetical protein
LLPTSTTSPTTTHIIHNVLSSSPVHDFFNCHFVRAPPYDRAFSDSGHCHCNCHLTASPRKQLNQPFTTTAHQHRHVIASTSPPSQPIHQQTHTAAMSGQGKLDQSLDEIMKDTKPARAGRGRAPRRAAAVKSAAATAAPAGGIAKKTRAPKGPRGAAPVAAAIPVSGESKIIVSGLVSQTILSCTLIAKHC